MIQCRSSRICCPSPSDWSDPPWGSAPGWRAKWARSPFRTASAAASCIRTSWTRRSGILIEQVGGVEGVYNAEGHAAGQLPRQADGGQRGRSAWHRRLSRVAGVDPRGSGRPLRHGPAPDSGNGRRAQSAGPAGRGHAVRHRRSDAGRPGTDLVPVGRNDQHAAARRGGTPQGMGRRFARKPEACRPPVFRPGTRSATCGRSSRQNPRGRTGRSSRPRR